MIALLLALGLFSIPDAFSTEHFAYPPEGIRVFELKSRASSAPIQILGSLAPPSLLINGKKVELDHGNVKGRSPGVYINSISITTQGEVGSFFESIDPKRAIDGQINVELVSEKSAKLGIFRMDKVFLEGEFRSTSEVIDPKTGKIEFYLSGFIPKGNDLLISQGKSEKKRDRQVEIHISLPQGQSTLSVKVVTLNGGQRVLNVPVEVKEVQFDSKKPVLSVGEPTDKIDGSQWIVPYYGFEIDGLVKNIEVLEINGQIYNQPDGEFSAFIVPQDLVDSIDFKFKDLEGKNWEVSKPLLCPECGIEPKWNKARYRTRGDFTFDLTGISTHWMTPRNGAASADFVRSAVGVNDLPIGKNLFARLGYHFSHKVNLGLSVRSRLKSASGTRIGRKLTINKDQRIEAEINYSLSEMIFAIGGLAYRKINCTYENFSVAPTTEEQALVGYFGLGARFPLSNKIEIVSRLALYPTQFTIPLIRPDVKWYDFVIDPIVLRFNF